MILKHHCQECDDKPTFCPFCSTYIIDDEMEQDDDY